MECFYTMKLSPKLFRLTQDRSCSGMGKGIICQVTALPLNQILHGDCIEVLRAPSRIVGLAYC